MNPLFEGRTGGYLRTAALAVLCVLALFLLFEAVSVAMGWRYIGTGIQATNTISVSGHGEYFAAPDIATFTYSVITEKPTVAEAQSDVTAKANAITSYLKAQGIDPKDIQTTGYSIQPMYDYQQAACPTSGGVGAPAYCPPGKQVLRGYQVDQETTVKVRDTSKAGDLLTAVGSKGATNVSGLSFTFDDPNAPLAEARNKAIADAKQKAEALAAQLGVSLVRVASFNESGNQPRPYPVAYGMGAGAVSESKAVAPDISVGQNQVTDDVTITYEIR